MKIPEIKLTNGISMPCIGLGTYPMKGDTLTQAIYNSYNVGYRLIDTADNYYNEEDLGSSLNILYNKTDAKRDDLFIISKISDELYEPGTLGGGSNKGKYFWKTSPYMATHDAIKKIVRKKLEDSLKNIKTDYLDLWLMHWPYPDFYEEIWYEMEEIYKKGTVRAIGVCNCRERHLLKLKDASIFPMVNQFESSPINTKENLIKFCKENKVQVMTYSPLMNLRINKSKEYNKYIASLGKKYKKTNSQIVLRYNIDMGVIPIPKSSNKERLESNINIFDFCLESNELNDLLKFNINKQYLPESKSCPGL